MFKKLFFLSTLSFSLATNAFMQDTAMAGIGKCFLFRNEIKAQKYSDSLKEDRSSHNVPDANDGTLALFTGLANLELPKKASLLLALPFMYDGVLEFLLPATIHKIENRLALEIDSANPFDESPIKFQLILNDITPQNIEDGSTYAVCNIPDFPEV